MTDISQMILKQSMFREYSNGFVSNIWSEETEKAYDAVQKLEEVTAVAAAKTCMQEMANAYRDTVLPVMEDLRKAVDALEVLLPSTMWPVPAYSEMIFNV